jgi:BirA family biotin operon repressor/biotin-[acetyl-CoA-carboxylase] ligase
MAAPFTLTIQRFATLDSTNTRAKEMARAGSAQGTMVVAEVQTAGRGRGANRWHSPSGGLYCSVLILPAPGRPPTDLPLLAGVCLSQTAKEILPKSHSVGLKWPNDLLISGRKAGGVLCEALGDDAAGLGVVGMGLNINTTPAELEPFRGNPFPATSFSAESGGGQYDIERALKVLGTKLTELCRLYHRDGFEPIRYLWERNCPMLNSRVTVQETIRGAGAPGAAMTGLFSGIDDSGALVLTADGQQKRFLTGEITCCW